MTDIRRQTVISANPYDVILSEAKNLGKFATRPFAYAQGDNSGSRLLIADG
ncbi:MAG: hypothetical protein U0L88_12445 [Acutalibacteraceae bacterium]|nr:hypothetical protein [Acutalibacteraceae bacterium]